MEVQWWRKGGIELADEEIFCMVVDEQQSEETRWMIPEGSGLVRWWQKRKMFRSGRSN